MYWVEASLVYGADQKSGWWLELRDAFGVLGGFPFGEVPQHEALAAAEQILGPADWTLQAGTWIASRRQV